MIELLVGQAEIGAEFGMDPANEAKVLEHTTAGNPQEGEDPAFASALLASIKGRVTPFDQSKGWGYQPPEHWELWLQDKKLAEWDIAAPAEKARSPL